MSVSANTIRFSGFVDSFSAPPAGAVAPAGAPFGNAVFTLPVTRAASVYFVPVALKPSRSVFGSNSIANFCVGMIADCVLDWISGSNFVVAPLCGSTCPIDATFTDDSPASTTSLGLKVS